MNLKTLYRKVISVGMAHDPRDAEELKGILSEEKKRMKKLSEEDSEGFDKDRLFNPYADTRILSGDGKAEIGKALVGIDMEVGELLLAYTLNRDRDSKIDLVVSHHPEGRALAQLHDVMKVQTDLLASYGVNVSVAEQLMEKRISEIERRLLPVNHNRAVDAARILGIPMMCVHTPADNCVAAYLKALFDAEKPARLKDIVELLKGIPEYRRSIARMAPPKIVSGTDDSRCGKIYVDMTGGTEGSKDIFGQYAVSGVSTIVGMHMSEDGLESAKKAKLNVVIAGHIASDTLGLNLLFDEVEKDGPLEIIGVSGFERIAARERGAGPQRPS
jgi:hypothetical protein